ncbi:MBL fold metallo-hydrolase [Candidatus Micrarchaeota archaeon]|nr:MBL fold metallo-hydrolase [Candidatus Micrarchaeota archaeon]MBD3417632.1 MBL fold metallo-hydrolase [Candidatus Micrarchaeota archaeon]
MIHVFQGSSSHPIRAESGTVATGYAIGEFAIDAPEGVTYPGSPLVLLTHAHCDHICGIAVHNLPYACSGFTAKAITEVRESATLCSHLGFQPPRRPPHQILKDGQALEGDGFSIKAIATPGHCEGAMCFYIPEHKALFSGDTVFGGGALPSVSLPTSSPKALLDSYEKLSNYEIEKIYPGHGGPFEAKGYIRALIPNLGQFI